MEKYFGMIALLQLVFNGWLIFGFYLFSKDISKLETEIKIKEK